MSNLIHRVAGRPWAIRSDVAQIVLGLARTNRGVSPLAVGELRWLAELKAAMHDPASAARGSQRAQPAQTVAVVPIIGTVTQRGDVIDSAQTRSTEEIAAEVRAAAAEPKVDAIVLEVDSPGGEVFGVPEAWQAIRDARRAKPVVAGVNSVAASAALYLASAADEIIVTPSGEAGSVGVYAMHLDMSAEMEQFGEKVTFVVAEDSPHKVEGNPYEPLSDDGRAQLQKAVNRYMAMFVRDLARGRGVSVDHVRQHFGGGRMLSPQEAVAVRMADSVGTIDHAVRRAAQIGRERREGGAPMRADLMKPGPSALDDLPRIDVDIDRLPPVAAQDARPAPAETQEHTAEQREALARLRAL